MTSIHLRVYVCLSFFYTPTNIWTHSSVLSQFARVPQICPRNGQQINKNAAAKVKQEIYLQSWQPPYSPVPEDPCGTIPAPYVRSAAASIHALLAEICEKPGFIISCHHTCNLQSLFKNYFSSLIVIVFSAVNWPRPALTNCMTPCHVHCEVVYLNPNNSVH